MEASGADVARLEGRGEMLAGDVLRLFPMDACDVVGHWGKHDDGGKVSGTGTGRTVAYERDLGLTGGS